MDYTELLFAAAVRELASALRSGASGEFSKTLDLPSESKWEAVDKWKAEHPVSEFVPQAFAQISEVASIIRSLR